MAQYLGKKSIIFSLLIIFILLSPVYAVDPPEGLNILPNKTEYKFGDNIVFTASGGFGNYTYQIYNYDDNLNKTNITANSNYTIKSSDRDDVLQIRAYSNDGGDASAFYSEDIYVADYSDSDSTVISSIILSLCLIALVLMIGACFLFNNGNSDDNNLSNHFPLKVFLVIFSALMLTTALNMTAMIEPAYSYALNGGVLNSTAGYLGYGLIVVIMLYFLFYILYKLMMYLQPKNLMGGKL